MTKSHVKFQQIVNFNILLHLDFLKKILNPSPQKRYTITQIKQDKWFMR